MKIADILLETPKDEHRLQLIAKNLVRKIKNEVAKEKKYREQDALRGLPPEPPYIELGFLKDVISTKALSYLFNRLGRTKVNVNFGREATEIGGWFDSATNTIEINYPFQAEKNLPEVESIIVHELRHALDNSKSRGWALNSTTKNKQQPIEYKGDDYEYYAAPHEINARFSQALNNITKLIKQNLRANKKLTIEDFMSQIYPIFKEYNLIDIFPSKNEIAPDIKERKPLDNKDYRRLINRAIKYFQEELFRLKK